MIDCFYSFLLLVTVNYWEDLNRNYYDFLKKTNSFLLCTRDNVTKQKHLFSFQKPTFLFLKRSKHNSSATFQLHTTASRNRTTMCCVYICQCLQNKSLLIYYVTILAYMWCTNCYKLKLSVNAVHVLVKH